jgi:hypothetical protein
MATVQLKQGFILGLLGIYVVYGIFGIGMTGLLFSFAAGLLVLSVNQPIEVVVAATIISGLAWKLLFNRRKEGFQVPVGTGSTGPEIVRKVEQIKRKDVFQPSGVLSSSFAEGFQNANDTSGSTQQQNTTSTEEKKPSESPESKPANANAASATSELAKAMPNPAAAADANAKTTSGFADKPTDGMFKLGAIPADAVGGAHIDVGTTLMNALNSLKPDQVKQMTDDTKTLLETQKNLMGMLSSMKPMLQDGKQLMTTFQDMFGGK